MIIGWQVNGTSVGQLMNPNIIPQNIRDESSHLIDILKILALPEYNNTEVQCVAITLVPNVTTELTPVATLIIQEGIKALLIISKLNSHTHACIILYIALELNNSIVSPTRDSGESYGMIICLCLFHFVKIILLLV